MAINKEGRSISIDISDKPINFFPNFYFSRFKEREKILLSLTWGKLDLINKYINSNNVNAIQDKSGNTPIALVLQGNSNDKMRVVRHLINIGANINSVNNFNAPPILFAMLVGKVDIVKLLISAGANSCLIKNNEIGSSYLFEYGSDEMKQIFSREFLKCPKE